MSSQRVPPIEESFEISAVSRLTGISTHTLRIWERRYGLVSPIRSDSKRRRYTREDIRLLTLVKTLVDNGDSVGTIAKLTIQQLESRIRENLSSSNPSMEIEKGTLLDENAVCRIAMVSPSTLKLPPEMTIVAKSDTIEELEKMLKPGAIDILMIECTTLFKEDIQEIQALVDRLEARRGVIVYHYSQKSTISEFDHHARNLIALKSPVIESEFRAACLADILMLKRTPPKIEKSIPPSNKTTSEIPPRMFSPADLEKIAQIASVVQCECPQHLSAILTSLNGFEKYSQECENRNEDDALLHAHLHRTTAAARHMMEKALADVLKADGIELD